ncbi:hypothetical protein OM076_43295 [Solirubrobacter ginsenosidimutans]|uniref:Uncharacterized protein n=1 Tax=Solirubrobacter ginsenosidimutans TaxID=490573 RepID=A0A9X3N526_9ACTN|nr:hypothetical protein [Solirubrobacter ginsenosidimutans]MDA0167165.1 hypothetical protein [Solirubrobacter ginsenosidimutans]
MDDGELRRAYRTLDEPMRVLGISLTGWASLLVACGLGYAWLLISPLGWRASVSVAVVVFGGPAALLALREQSTIGPGRLLLAVVRWRLRAPMILTPAADRRTRRGGVRLDVPAPSDDAVSDTALVDGWPAASEGAA